MYGMNDWYRDSAEAFFIPCSSLVTFHPSNEGALFDYSEQAGTTPSVHVLTTAIIPRKDILLKLLTLSLSSSI